MEQPAAAELEALLRARSFHDAATLALDLYGPEVYGYLVNYFGNETDAAEVFSQVSEDLWRGLPGFAFRCTFRTWLYTLARNAAFRYTSSPWNARDRRTGDSGLDDQVARARTRTQPWLQTDVKDRWRALRDALEPEDRSLLVLRIDRNLPWEDVARVSLGIENPDELTLGRETDRLRKRFQLLKEDLRRRAQEAGLLDDPT